MPERDYRHRYAGMILNRDARQFVLRFRWDALHPPCIIDHSCPINRIIHCSRHRGLLLPCFVFVLRRGWRASQSQMDWMRIRDGASSPQPSANSFVSRSSQSIHLLSGPVPPPTLSPEWFFRMMTDVHSCMMNELLLIAFDFRTRISSTRSYLVRSSKYWNVSL